MIVNQRHEWYQHARISEILDVTHVNSHHIRHLARCKPYLHLGFEIVRGQLQPIEMDTCVLGDDHV